MHKIQHAAGWWPCARMRQWIFCFWWDSMSEASCTAIKIDSWHMEYLWLHRNLIGFSIHSSYAFVPKLIRLHSRFRICRDFFFSCIHLTLGEWSSYVYIFWCWFSWSRISWIWKPTYCSGLCVAARLQSCANLQLIAFVASQTLYARKVKKIIEDMAIVNCMPHHNNQYTNMHGKNATTNWHLSLNQQNYVPGSKTAEMQNSKEIKSLSVFGRGATNGDNAD